jgi:hypothetical protein
LLALNGAFRSSGLPWTSKVPLLIIPPGRRGTRFPAFWLEMRNAHSPLHRQVCGFIRRISSALMMSSPEVGSQAWQGKGGHDGARQQKLRSSRGNSWHFVIQTFRKVGNLTARETYSSCAACSVVKKGSHELRYPLPVIFCKRPLHRQVGKFSRTCPAFYHAVTVYKSVRPVGDSRVAIIRIVGFSQLRLGRSVRRTLPATSKLTCFAPSTLHIFYSGLLLQSCCMEYAPLSGLRKV